MNRSDALRTAAKLSADVGTARVKAAAAQTAFREVAAAWDAWYAAFHRAEDTSLDALASRLGALARGGRLLELGCGDGRLLAALSPLCRSVDGAEASVRALAFARATTRGLANVRLKRLRAWELPYADGAFDAVVCQRTLHVLDPEAVFLLLRESGRVLAPGGRVAFNLPNFHHEPHLDSLTRPGVLPWPSLTRPRFWTPDMVRAALPRLGLTVVSIKTGGWIDVVAQHSETSGRTPRAAKKRASTSAVR